MEARCGKSIWDCQDLIGIRIYFSVCYDKIPKPPHNSTSARSRIACTAIFTVKTAQYTTTAYRVVDRKGVGVCFLKICNLRKERKKHLVNLAEGFSESSQCLLFLVMAMTTKPAWDSMLVMTEETHLPWKMRYLWIICHLFKVIN